MFLEFWRKFCIGSLIWRKRQPETVREGRLDALTCSARAKQCSKHVLGGSPESDRIGAAICAQ